MFIFSNDVIIDLINIQISSYYITHLFIAIIKNTKNFTRILNADRMYRCLAAMNSLNI